MLISFETDCYNERRYGKPWIARVTFENSKKGDFIWGDWIGEKGMEGLLEIDVSENDIIAMGQKDYRKPRNSAPDWYYIDGCGDRVALSKVEAYKHYRSNKEKEKKPVIKHSPARKLIVA